MKKPLIVLAAAVAALSLTACDSDAHKGEHCVRSHVQHDIIPVVTMVGQVPVTTYIPSDTTVCDEWAPNNPATVKP